MRISSNTVIRNEIRFVDGLVANLLDAGVDEALFLDGGSTDGTYERLIKYSGKHSQITVLSWPQKQGTALRRGFREVDRRNLLKSISTGDYILAIDADERISPGFRRYVGEGRHVAIPIVQFWGRHVRVNTRDDRVWDAFKVRLLRNSKFVRYHSKDPNGLHCYLSKYGWGIRSGGSRVKRLLRVLLGIAPRKEPRITLYHLHYLRLVRKDNDLRSGDLANGEVVLVQSAEEGLQYDRRERHVICVRELTERERKDLEHIARYDSDEL